MLKKISPLLSPELLRILCEMGHGDEIVLGDGNFPHASMAQYNLVRLDGHPCDHVLEAILSVFPLDEGNKPVAVMQTDDGSIPSVWSIYEETLEKYDYVEGFEKVERQDFYNRAKKAYCIVATSEPSLYANLILKKGCV